VYPVGLNYYYHYIITRYIGISTWNFSGFTIRLHRWGGEPIGDPVYILTVYSIYTVYIYVCIRTSGPLVPGYLIVDDRFYYYFFLDARRRAFCALHTRPDLLSSTKSFFLSCDGRGLLANITPRRYIYTRAHTYKANTKK